MAIGSGIGSQFGFSAESVYGTYVAPTKFVRGTSYSIDPKPERVQGEGIQAGVLGMLSSHFVETTKGVEASIEAEVQTSGFGLLLQAITGGTSTSAAQAATAAYLQTHTLGDDYGKSLTAQIGRPTRAGTAVPATIKGAKVTQAEFSCAVNEILKLALTLDGQSYDNTTALAVASYATAVPFHGAQMTLKLGAYGSEAAVSGVRSVSSSWSRPHDTADYTADATGLKAEPVLNAATEITGTISADWLAKATFEDVALANSSTSLVWQFEGATIATTYKQMFRMTLPVVHLEPAAQGVGGRSELTTDWTYTWKYDGTNLPKIEYQTVDTAL